MYQVVKASKMDFFLMAALKTFGAILIRGKIKSKKLINAKFLQKKRS